MVAVAVVVLLEKIDVDCNAAPVLPGLDLLALEIFQVPAVVAASERIANALFPQLLFELFAIGDVDEDPEEARLTSLRMGPRIGTIEYRTYATIARADAQLEISY